MYGQQYLFQYEGKSNRRTIFYHFDAGHCDDWEALALAFRRKMFLSAELFELVVGIGRVEESCYLLNWVGSTIAFGPSHISFVLMPDVDWAAFMPALDYYILGSEADEALGLLDFAYASGVKIIPFGKVRGFYFISDDPEALSVRGDLRDALERQLFSKYDPGEYEYMSFQHGLAETIIYFYLFRQYRQRSRKKLLLFTRDPKRTSIMQECPHVDAVADLPPVLSAYLTLYCGESHHVRNSVANWFDARAMRLRLDPRHEGYMELELAQRFLGLPLSPTMGRYPVAISAKRRRMARDKFAELGLRQGRSVFLIADGMSTRTGGFTSGFWRRLIDKLRELDYDVVVKSERRLFPDVPCAYFPPLETAAFAGLCGNVLSILTGIAFVIGAFCPPERLRHMKFLAFPDNDFNLRETNFTMYMYHTVVKTVKASGTDMADGEYLREFRERQLEMWRYFSDVPCECCAYSAGLTEDEYLDQVVADM